MARKRPVLTALYDQALGTVGYSEWSHRLVIVMEIVNRYSFKCRGCRHTVKP